MRLYEILKTLDIEGAIELHPQHEMPSRRRAMRIYQSEVEIVVDAVLRCSR